MKQLMRVQGKLDYWLELGASIIELKRQIKNTIDELFAEMEENKEDVDQVLHTYLPAIREWYEALDQIEILEVTEGPQEAGYIDSNWLRCNWGHYLTLPWVCNQQDEETLIIPFLKAQVIRYGPLDTGHVRKFLEHFWSRHTVEHILRALEGAASPTTPREELVDVPITRLGILPRICRQVFKAIPRVRRIIDRALSLP